MISTQIFNYRWYSLLGFVMKPHLRQSVQEWIRKEIVDDDPYTQETFFPGINK